MRNTLAMFILTFPSGGPPQYATQMGMDQKCFGGVLINGLAQMILKKIIMVNMKTNTIE